MPNCAVCGTENPRGVFCGECGSPLAPRCPKCGAEVEQGLKFCRECGAALQAGGTVPSERVETNGDAEVRSPLSERRVCSVLFVDLVGFTSLSESRDPEEVRELLSRYFEVARQLVGRYGGVIEKFIGDAVMAVWGTPVASEEDTERAVRAALELVAAIGALGDEIGASGLAARAGVVTGEVAVNIGASGEGMVAGDAVNTASRVQSAATPGTVFVDEQTRRLAERAISFESVGTVELKGKEHPEPLYRASRVLSGVGGRQRSDGLEAPFSGRDGELRTLKELFHTAVDRRSPRLVVLSGVAGVGKSRLGWEFEKYVDGLADTVLWHRGRCLSYGEGVAFWALAEIVRQRFGIAEEDGSGVAAQKLQEGMVRFVRDEDERDYVGVRLSRLLGVPYSSESKAVLSAEELYAGWRLFFERLAEVAPVAILVEDAQHADAGLLAFIDHLVDWTRNLPIFVLVFARPGLPAIDSGFGVGRNRSTLSLDPLDDASMAELVNALVPGMPQQATAAITTRAQGIALFAVETVRSLLDRGIVVKEGDASRLVGDIGDLAVPDSLHSLLAARLDALSPEVRALVADASVVGSSFPKDALVAVSGRQEQDVVAGLAELVRRDVLEIFADPLSPERGAYRFGQEMLRQVAYETLSKRDRKSRHLAVAAHLRRSFGNDGEEIADVIARHYLDALAAGPKEDDAGEISVEALGFLKRAAVRAERSGALSRAAESYVLAADIASAEEAASLYESAANAWIGHDDIERAAQAADAALEGFAKLGEGREIARARVLRARCLIRAGDPTGSAEELRAALAIFGEEETRDAALALMNLCNCELHLGHHERAEEVANRALVVTEGLDDNAEFMARILVNKSVILSTLNRRIEAEACLRQSARLAESIGHGAILGLALANLADAVVIRDPVAALGIARSAAEHARRSGHRRYLVVATGNVALALFAIGDWDEAERVLTEGVETDGLDHVFLLDSRAILASLRGDFVAADAALETAAGKTAEGQERLSVLLAQTVRAWAADERRKALELGLEVLAHRDEVGMTAEEPRMAWPIAARAAWKLGESSTLEELFRLVDEVRPGHQPPELRAARQLLGALSDPNPDSQTIELADAALSRLRASGPIFQLAEGLIDYAGILRRAGEEGSGAALEEALEIAERLRSPVIARQVAEYQASLGSARTADRPA